MNNPTISIIAAIGKNRELGKNNKLLWHIPEDLKFFKEKTRGHVVIMGRKTYESIGHPLPNRANIIITKNTQFNVPGAITAHSLADALQKAQEVEKEEIFIIGGAKIYEQSLSLANKLYLTLIPGKYDADVYFTEYQSLFPNVLSKKVLQDSGVTFLELTK
ncbi:hypothetical protein A2773_03665 [Candidatus Gottesmanbacteria bacterium RIFCSPHIGHO2_01_FULL_39_10]|uniref:Dihydrofolate reductase n=1 Tax=Candidatus Gottesmanbacteria bacterium RIFCSPHIGHO2_01_FULL_39_10 TaxID=1798375 RepID=A0A1F5ZSE7_9BACT|nr:MAG: hypothetical protein A2773_03665 [Candidatus Gottesmanbacteria bacterium RIFCSPHIGHO2_01_FULL_39_10]